VSWKPDWGFGAGERPLLFTQSTTEKEAVAEVPERGVQLIVIKRDVDGATCDDLWLSLSPPAFLSVEVDSTKPRRATERHACRRGLHTRQHIGNEVGRSQHGIPRGRYRDVGKPTAEVAAHKLALLWLYEVRGQLWPHLIRKAADSIFSKCAWKLS
jgi:hypothetical protein